MKILRNPWLWITCASLMFVGFMYSIANKPIPIFQDDASWESDLGPPEPFLIGLITAGVLVAAWKVAYIRVHPRWGGRLRNHMPDNRGEPVVHASLAAGRRFACVRSLKSGKMIVLELEAHFPENDLSFDEDVHLIAYRTNCDDDRMGTHEFSRSCSCQPEIMEQAHERTIIIHL